VDWETDSRKLQLVRDRPGTIQTERWIGVVFGHLLSILFFSSQSCAARDLSRFFGKISGSAIIYNEKISLSSGFFGGSGFFTRGNPPPDREAIRGARSLMFPHKENLA
jgi:hypothetical protein